MNDVDIMYYPPEAVYVVELWSMLDVDSNVFFCTNASEYF